MERDRHAAPGAPAGSDLFAPLLGVLAERVAGLIADRFLGQIVEVLAERVAEKILAARSTEMVGVAGLAERWGCSVEAAEKRVGRDKELAKLAVRMGRRRMWRASEVEHLLSVRRNSGG